jgi:stalled ribosome rescue protein Dom34
MQNHYHAVVWIDHRQARVFHFSASASDKATMHADNPVQHLHHKSNSPGSGRAPEDESFLEAVAKSIGDAGAILIAGPSSEKNELAKHIRRAHPELALKIEGVETVDHPTDNEILAYARRYLKSADMMYPKS